jgi:hypothetical protein
VDPVGTYGIPEALSEYDGYTGKIANLLRGGATEDDLVRHLGGLMDGFGLPVQIAQDRVAAAQILAWYRQSMERMNELVSARSGEITATTPKP